MKLSIIATHPIQYYAPWFRHLTATEGLTVKVFYLWDFGVTEQLDAGFQQALKWDIPLLEGYDHEFVPNISKRPGTSHFWGLVNPTLNERVRSFAPNAVLLFGYKYDSLIRFILGWRASDAPLLFRGDSHRMVVREGIKEWLRRQMIALVYRRFAGFLYVGKANYDYFRYHGVPDQKLFFAPHAVDNERFFAQHDDAVLQAIEWKKELGIPDRHRIILFAGKFEEKKRPLDLLQAFQLANLEDVSLLFVGAGPLEEDLGHRANSYSNVYFAPFQNQTYMPRTYAVADLVVLPSESETWGLAINEAMCMARAVIVSSHVGCAQDLVHKGLNGMVFPAGNVAALTDCIKKAFFDRSRLRLWGEEGRKMVSEYSYKQMTNGLLNAVNAVTNRLKDT